MNGKAKAQQRTLISTGATSMVLVFVMLCLITFAVLSLVSAQADLRLSRKSAERTTDYYAAENAANDTLIALIDILDSNANAPSAETYYVAVQQAALRSSALADVEFHDVRFVSWQVPLGDAQVLQVELELSYQPQADGQHYRLLTWQAVADDTWNEEQPLELFDPGAIITG